MIKTIPRTDIVVRPFITYKNWSLQNLSYDSFLLTEDGCPLFTYYTTESGQLCNVNSCFPSYSLATEIQSADTRIKVNLGQSGSGIFYPSSSKYYNYNNNPTNRDGTYKRLIYDSVSKLFYNNFENPLKLFGIEDYESGKEVRNLVNPNIIVTNISNTTYGETIQANSVEIIDNSSVDQQVIIEDDGYTNLIVQNSILASQQEIGAPPVLTGSSYYNPDNDRFGSSLSAWNDYIIVGSPLDNNSFSQPKAGAAYLYKFDPNSNQYRFIKNFYSPFTQNGYSTEVGYDNNNLLLTEIGFFLSLNNDSGNGGYAINDNFGISVNVNSNVLAIGSPSCDFCGDVSGSGQVYVYEKYKGGTDHWGIVNILQGSCSLDLFGTSVCLNGTKLAIGAPGANNGKGKVYIFKQDIYGVTVPTSSYWFKITEENDSCTTLVSEFIQPTQSLIVNTPISGSPYIIPENPLYDSGSYYINDINSSDCNISYSLYDFPLTQSLITENSYSVGPVTNLETDFQGYFDFVTEDETPTFITSNSIWNLEEIIETNSPEFSGFGYAISFSGSYLLVGNNSPSGSVYLFESQSIGWNRTYRFDRDKIINTLYCTTCSYADDKNTFNLYNSEALSTYTSNSYFGNSVCVSNQSIIIGVPQDLSFIPYSGSLNSYQVGSAYFYTLGSSSYDEILGYNCGITITQSGINTCGWSLFQKIYESSSISFVSNNFGYSITSDGNRFVIGSLYGESFVTSSYNPLTQEVSIQDIYLNSNGPLTNNALQGKAFVYKFTEPSNDYFYLEHTIVKQKISGVIKKSYGYSVAVDNNHIIVGAPTFMYGDVAAQYYVYGSGSYNTGSNYESQSYYVTEYSGSENSASVSSSLFVTDYDSSGYFQPFSYNFEFLQEFIPPSVSGSVYVYDINELYVSHSAGNIFYKNGIIIINNTSSVFTNTFLGSGDNGYSLSFNGTHTIYEHEVQCTINPGEFNVSTNPTSVIQGRIPYDIINDGVFNITDFDLIMRYYAKFIIISNIAATENDDGILAESQNPEQWWSQQLIMTESDDVIWLEPYINDGLITTEEQLLNLNSTIYNYLVSLDQQGLLDINGDGQTTTEDANILMNYFQGIRGISMVQGNITPNSTRTTSSEIASFLNTMTGLYNGTNILSTFTNFQESSSIDPTGSYLAPYITTIGLYQNGLLVAVAKLGQPIKNPINYPINFLVRYDS